MITQGKCNEQCEPPGSNVTLILLWCSHCMFVGVCVWLAVAEKRKREGLPTDKSSVVALSTRGLYSEADFAVALLRTIPGCLCNEKSPKTKRGSGALKRAMLLNFVFSASSTCPGSNVLKNGGVTYYTWIKCLHLSNL